MVAIGSIYFSVRGAENEAMEVGVKLILHVRKLQKFPHQTSFKLELSYSVLSAIWRRPGSVDIQERL